MAPAVQGGLCLPVTQEGFTDLEDLLLVGTAHPTERALLRGKAITESPESCAFEG